MPQVKEPLLVRDVLYACQGISGRFTLYQEQGSYGPGSGLGGWAAGDQDTDMGGFVVSAQVSTADGWGESGR